jgi:hypothetical protein
MRTTTTHLNPELRIGANVRGIEDAIGNRQLAKLVWVRTELIYRMASLEET